jgi:hypothetical protein
MVVAVSESGPERKWKPGRRSIAGHPELATSLVLFFGALLFINTFFEGTQAGF